MNLLDLLTKSGGAASIGNLASGLGLDSSKSSALIGALAPALMSGLQKQTEQEGGLDSLTKALQKGNHQKYLDQPELMAGAETAADGNKILGHLFGGKDGSRSVAAQAAEQTGIDVGLIKKALPFVASLTMAAVSKSSDAGQSLGDSLPGLLGGMLKDGIGLDDVMGFAKKLF